VIYSPGSTPEGVARGEEPGECITSPKGQLNNIIFQLLRFSNANIGILECNISLFVNH